MKNISKYALFLITALISTTIVGKPIMSKWTVTRNWENVVTPPGSVLQPNDGIQYFQDAANKRCYVNSSIVHSGTRSVECRVASPYVRSDSGDTVWAGGFGVGTGNTSDTVVEGDEVWARVWLYLSPNWSWADAGHGSELKLFRVYPFPTYEGEFIVQWDKSQGKLRAQSQGLSGGDLSLYGGTSADASGPSAVPPIGAWFMVDTYVKISADPNKALWRVWLNEKLILERTGNKAPHLNKQSLNRAGSNVLIKSPGIIFFSTWDGDPTTNNISMYVDDVIVTSDPAQATKTDAVGNKLIGDKVMNGGTVPPIPPPTGLNVLFNEQFVDTNFASRGWKSSWNGTMYNPPERGFDSTLGKNYVAMKWDAGQQTPRGMGDVDYNSFTASNGEITSVIFMNFISWNFNQNHHLLSIFGSTDNMTQISPPNAILDVLFNEVSKNNIRSITPGYVNRGQGGDFFDQQTGAAAHQLSLNAWYEVRTYIKLNTIGSSNGILRCEIRPINGITWVTTFNRTNVQFRLTNAGTLHYPAFRMHIHNGATAGDEIRIADWKIYAGNQLGVPLVPPVIPPSPPSLSVPNFDTMDQKVRAAVNVLRTQVDVVGSQTTNILAALDEARSKIA